MAPRILFFSRFQQVVVLAGLLLCALALVGTTYFAASETKTIPAATPSIARPATKELPRRATVRPFDGSCQLKAGDLVVLSAAGTSQVRKVAAAPNEAVLLRSGNALHALYMAGKSSYVVMSEKDSRIVSASQIHAVIPSAVQ